MYADVRFATSEMNIFPSKFDRAIGWKFAGLSDDPDLCKIITACCQVLEIAVLFHSLQIMVQSLFGGEGHFSIQHQWYRWDQGRSCCAWVLGKLRIPRMSENILCCKALMERQRLWCWWKVRIKRSGQSKQIETVAKFPLLQRFVLLCSVVWTVDDRIWTGLCGIGEDAYVFVI